MQASLRVGRCLGLGLLGFLFWLGQICKKGSRMGLKMVDLGFGPSRLGHKYSLMGPIDSITKDKQVPYIKI